MSDEQPYPTAVFAWSYRAPDAVTILILAPAPCRLLLRAYKPNPQPVIRSRTHVLPDLQGAVQSSHNRVDAAVVIQVAEGCAAMHRLSLEVLSCGGVCICKPAVFMFQNCVRG